MFVALDVGNAPPVEQLFQIVLKVNYDTLAKAVNLHLHQHSVFAIVVTTTFLPLPDALLGEMCPLPAIAVPALLPGSVRAHRLPAVGIISEHDVASMSPPKETALALPPRCSASATNVL